MKVLLVSASPRHKRNTYTALSEVAKTLEQDGIEAEVVEIGTKPVGGCIACNWCKQHAEEHRCAFNNDCVNAISAKAEEADAFVFGARSITGNPMAVRSRLSNVCSTAMVRPFPINLWPVSVCAGAAVPTLPTRRST